MEDDERAQWLFPRRQGTLGGGFGDIDLSLLDPADPDDRHFSILADHPELQAAIDDDVHEIEIDGEPMNPTLHISFHEIIANQIMDGTPPEAWQTAQRLQDLGYGRHDILHMMASVVARHVWDTLSGKPYDHDYVAELNTLPGSWKPRRRLDRPPRPAARPRARARPAQRPKGGGRKRKRR